MTVLAPAAYAERFARYRAWAPEWWLLVPIVAAWVLVAGHTFADALAGTSTSGAGLLRSGPVLLFACLIPSARTAGPDTLEPAAMSVAVMLPLALPAVRHVALNSLGRRRRRAMVLYVFAFVGPMVIAGVATALIVDTFVTDRRVALVLALLVAAGYQLSRPKHRALADCRRSVPLPPDGIAADAAVVRFGLLSAWRCLRASWALMLPAAVLGGAAAAASFLVMWLLLAEDPGRFGRRILTPSAALLAVAALLVAVMLP